MEAPRRFSEPRAALLVACGASLALLVTLRLAPGAPWRLPLALVGGLWAPGYALLAAVHPLKPEGLRGWERHALAAGFGLLLAPLAGLAASLLFTFDAPTVGATLCLPTLICGAIGLFRARGEGPVRFAHAPPPGTLPTLAVCAAMILVLVALGMAPTPGASADVPASLVLAGPDGRASSLPLRVGLGEDGLALVEVHAGSQAEEGALRVTWTPFDGGRERTLLVETLALGPGETARRELALPTGEAGFFRLAVHWQGRGELDAHAWIEVAGPPPEEGA